MVTIEEEDEDQSQRFGGVTPLKHVTAATSAYVHTVMNVS